ncbi:MAG: hypothetical protein ACRDP3_08355 [Streptomyces sp.]|uniref:hypothetical protein n=1 Tax=Streptomyces sp. TaxID=1931 RepID=UPI003D6B59C6
MPTLIRRLSGAAALVFALVFAFPVSASAGELGDTARPAAAQSAQISGDPAPEGFKTGDLTDLAPPDAGKRDAREPAWSYHITSSCSGYESSIRQGANWWGGGTETSSSGTPVECTGGYVQGCGGGNVVGCNWGQGDRIMLSTLVSDFGLLAAHEFGHNWYGHSAAGCANWGSDYEIMRPTMC